MKDCHVVSDIFNQFSTFRDHCVELVDRVKETPPVVAHDQTLTTVTYTFTDDEQIDGIIEFRKVDLNDLTLYSVRAAKFYSGYLIGTFESAINQSTFETIYERANR